MEPVDYKRCSSVPQSISQSIVTSRRDSYQRNRLPVAAARMGKIIYAHVTYQDQPQKHYTVRISDVKCKRNSETHISPTSETDFDKRKIYYVKWTDCGSACEIDHAHFGYYPAFLHYVGDSLGRISRQIEEGGRLIIPSGLPSSESEENFEPIRSQKHTNLLQAVQKKKNAETLNKLKSQEFLSSRKPLIHDSGDEDENEEPAESDKNVDGVSSKDNQKTVPEIELHKRTRVRRDVFGKTDNPLYPAESLDQVNKRTQLEDCCGSSERPAAVITRIQNVYYNVRTLNKHNPDDDNESGKKYPQNKKGFDISAEDLISAGPSRPRSPQNLPAAVIENEERKDPENEHLALHSDPLDDIDDEENNDQDEERGNKQRLPLRGKKRKRQNVEGGLKKKAHREIYAALEYFKNPEPDPDGKRMYEVADEQICLWEGITVPASVWYLIKQNKPQIFFSSMIEMLWPPETLVNRCQKLKTVTTRLLGRSPMKELTPRKKILSYKLYADYLDDKKIKGSEKLAYLMKVPYLYTTKINYLRGQYYE